MCVVPLLTNKDISLTERGRLYSRCVQSSMLHGSETWSVRKENEVALQQTEIRIVRWICGVKRQDRVPSKGLRETRITWHNFSTTAKQIAMGMCCKKKTVIGWRNVWSMKWRVPDQEVDQRKLGERLWKKDCQTHKLNREDAMDHKRWRKQISGDWW